jgi:hypothetical protein
MPRALVGLVLSLALCIACTDGSSLVAPAAADRGSGTSRSASLPPIASGVHTSVLVGLDNFFANGLNDWGEVVGETGAPDSLSVAFHWQVQRGLTQLVIPGTTGSGASAVNNNGEVAITVFYPDFSYKAARWSWNGDVHVLPLLSNWSLPLPDSTPNCSPAAINDQNVMLGVCSVIGLSQDVVTVWTAAGRPDVVRAGASPLFGFPYGLTDGGIGVGDGVVAGGRAGAFAGPIGGGGVIFLPITSVPGAFDAEAMGVNDSGSVAGWISIATNPACTHAVIWTAAHTVRDLGLCGSSNAIDDNGVVAGTATDSVTRQTYAFVWTADSGARRLPGVTAHDVMSEAKAINRAHQILGTVYESGGPWHNVIWTVP